MALERKTPLYETHLRYGGKIVEFGGWLLPVQYSGILEEHRAVREKAGLFDVSHMGEVRVTGPDAFSFVQKLVTNDISRLVNFKIQYSPMCYADGGIVDDLLIYKQGTDEYYLVINAGNIDKDWQWMQDNKHDFDINLINLSDDTAQLALQGPLAQSILSQLTDAPLDELGYYWFLPNVIVAGKETLVSRTGYTGEDGFEIYCKPVDAAALWEAIMSIGSPRGLLPAGLGCRDTLRFEACLPLYGHELSKDISPLEAGLGSFVKLDKGDFNGHSALAKQKKQGVKRKSIGFAMIGRGIARAEYPVIAAGRRIGTVTTGTYSPSLNKNIGLALVESEFAQIGQSFEIEIRGKNVAAEVIAKPFYKREGK